MPYLVFLILRLLLLFIALEWIIRQRATNQTTTWETRPLSSLDLKATRIVVLGDSIAYGFELPEDEPWPFLLEKQLQQTYSDRRWQVINASVSGHTVADAYVRFDEHVKHYQPHVVIIALGTNDCRKVNRMNDERRQAQFARNEQTWWGNSYAGRAIANHLRPLPVPNPDIEFEPATGPRTPPDIFRSILAWLTTQSQRIGAQPVLLTLTPHSPAVDYPEFALLGEYSAVIRETARNFEVPFIELSHQFPGDQPWLADGVHLSTEGETIVADRVWNGLHRPNLAPILHLQTYESNAEMAPSLE